MQTVGMFVLSVGAMGKFILDHVDKRIDHVESRMGKIEDSIKDLNTSVGNLALMVAGMRGALMHETVISKLPVEHASTTE